MQMRYGNDKEICSQFTIRTYGKTLLKMINDCELGGKAALSPSDWRTMVLIMRQCAAGGGFGMHCWPNRTARR